MKKILLSIIVLFVLVSGAVAADPVFYMNIPSGNFIGVYSYDGTSWTQLNNVSASNLVLSNGELYATFPGFGEYKYNRAACQLGSCNVWDQVSPIDGNILIAGGENMTTASGEMYMLVGLIVALVFVLAIHTVNS
jgi:glutamine cyclotransferase